MQCNNASFNFVFEYSRFAGSSVSFLLHIGKATVVATAVFGLIVANGYNMMSE